MTAAPPAPKAHIKRRLRDPLARWPSHHPLELMGPRGVGKRTLASKLPQSDIVMTHRQPSQPGGRSRVRLHPFTWDELGLRTPDAFVTWLGKSTLPHALWSKPTLSGPIALIDDSSRFCLTSALGASLWQGVCQQVGQPLSVHALARSLGIADRTVVRTLGRWHEHYGLFAITPWVDRGFRALKKSSKVYPIEAMAEHHPLVQLEAGMALHLKTWVDNQNDVYAQNWRLHFFRDCDQREVDFVLVHQDRPQWLIQIDAQGQIPNRHLRYLQKKYPTAQAWQVSLDGPMTPYSERSGLTVAHPLALWQKLIHETSP